MSELPSRELAAQIVARSLANGGEFAELFAERSGGLQMSIDESRVEDVVSGAEQGAGLRVIKDGTAYFAHVDGLAEADLLRAAEEVSSALRGSRAEPLPMKASESRAAAGEPAPGGGSRGAQIRAPARARRAGSLAR